MEQFIRRQKVHGGCEKKLGPVPPTPS